AVSKTRTASAIRQAHANGLTEFGENYLNEALPKIVLLQDLDLVWHFIGPIQSNKTRAIAEHFSWVHSIDRAKVARRLNNQRPDQMAPLQVCIQVNISLEQSKSGIALEALPALVREILDLPRLRLRGLMAIPTPTRDEKQQRQEFALLHDAMHQLFESAPTMDTLSMGMSGDMEAAIAEGSNLVRIGTDIFGPRKT
ncbi:MAG: YggS family pyridoxal phosphate-dependent enzyme, partial [Halieaceae bacterium]|nr:YggS family pyridoxal phosphate-dependent enzyme [Halieaceae bacterium]